MKEKISLLLLFFSLSFYGQNDTISVVKHTDNDFVIPKDLKVVYRGITNELFIDVPNCKSFNVTGEGLTLKSKNIYNLNPAAGNEVIITIHILLKNFNRIREEYKFTIRNFPRFMSFINGILSDKVFQFNKEQLKDAIISIKSIDKNLNLSYETEGFTFKTPGKKSIEIKGNKIDEYIYSKIRNCKKGDLITISDIRILTCIGCSYPDKINPIVIEILN